MIGRKDMGELQFLGPVDVRGLDLDATVEIDKGRIQVCSLTSADERNIGSAEPHTYVTIIFYIRMPFNTHYMMAVKDALI